MEPVGLQEYTVLVLELEEVVVRGHRKRAWRDRQSSHQETGACLTL